MCINDPTNADVFRLSVCKFMGEMVVNRLKPNAQLKFAAINAYSTAKALFS